MTVYELYEQLEQVISQDQGELDVMLDVDSGLYFVSNVELDIEIYNNHYTYLAIKGGTD